MGTGIITCLIAMVLFVGLIFVASVLKSRLFSFEDSSIHSKKTAAECATIMLNAYAVKNEEYDSDNNENNNDENQEDENNEEDDDEDVDEDADTDEDEDEGAEKHLRKYEDISDEGKQRSTRVYESFDDGSVKEEDNSLDDEKVTVHSCVEVIKGKQKYGISGGRDFSVMLSSDIYDSDSLPAACIACYQAVKLSEGVDKPLKYRLISFLNFVPKMICQVSWIFASMISLGVLFLPFDASFIVGTISIISCLLALLDAVYYYELANITVSNMVNLEILNEDEIDWGKKMMSIIAFTESVRFLHSLRWFVNKILGYRV